MICSLTIDQKYLCCMYMLVPATKEGIPAINKLICSGVSVNVTLMFNMQHYNGVVEANYEFIGGNRTVIKICNVKRT